MEKIEDKLLQVLGKSKVLLGDAVKSRYDHIWRMDQSLNALAVTLPHSTQDVSQIMKICHDYNQPVVVHGGLTNLVGSTVTSYNEVVISLEKLNTIEEVDIGSRTITVGAGAILESVQIAAKENNMLFPLNFGAKGSAQIGGAIATNAGGLRVLRYGMTRNLVLGLEVVLADGTIISSLKKIIKDNSAYDIKQMFIGSEGTLGIITKAVLKMVELPISRSSAYVGINDFDKVVSLLKFLDAGLAGTLSGFELIWGETYKTMTSPPSTVSPPLQHGFKYYVLIESLGSDKEKDQEKMLSLLEEALDQSLIKDASPAYTDSDLEWFWKIREDVHVLVSQCKHDQHFDISIPIPQIGEVITSISKELWKMEGVENVYSFGHVADGNIHFIIGKSNNNDTLKNEINNTVYGPLQNLGGSVSAEHGIGLDKKAYLHLCRTAEEIELMKILKKTLDPLNLLNRGKVLDI